jgi:hypothetical protein
MTANVLRDVIEDAKAVKETARINAMNAFNQAFSNGGDKFEIENRGEGIFRYHYYNERSEDDALKDIEENGLIILEEDDEKWYDVIKPETMVENINGNDLAAIISKDISDEIDGEFLTAVKKCIEDGEKLKEKQIKVDEKLKRKYNKFVSFCKQKPWPIKEECIPGFDKWKLNNGYETEK